ncbi:MAG: ActS/PrrB/RegB family redox-sensitive histidine kinase [Rhodobacter sp.]|nr:ActS/PrrB/RegB family redox-sensitive histidine kinase [Paracoccaceae bacterium]MCC0077627.1 ActS/PrrB/RegB family redox-sensitive histidine kinase [Rhodobacter sp.]
MDAQADGLMNRDVQGHWVRLETLTRVRWLAASGQLAALLIARYAYELHFSLALCLAVVGVSAMTNLLSALIFPRTKRLSETEALLTLVFDTAQLSLLLFLTGGLNNPFSVMLIAPVTIAATALQLRSTLILGGLAIFLATLLELSFEPLRLRDGTPLDLPGLFRFGFWLALVMGIAFIGLYSRSVASEKHALAEALLAMRMALAREQKLTDIGGVVAAAAHELGTPLATIKLVSAELIDALDDPDLAEDARLIREQADRCRAILHSMGQAARDDLHLRNAPLEAIVTEAAAPHTQRGKQITFDALAGPDSGPMPEIHRRPEIIHGLRNLIQNAVDFAAGQVWVEIDWTDRTITLRVIDDGPGYPAHLLGRIGEPYLRDRRPENRRPEYEGMGLGLFIAKTLLERTGATVRFANCTGARLPQGFTGTRCGAMAEIVWMRAAVEADPRRALGQNIAFDDQDTP